MDDFVLTVKQIAQYPHALSIKPTDAVLIQQDLTGAGPLGGPYAWVDAPTIFATALATAGWLQLAPFPNGGIAFNGASLAYNAGRFEFSEMVIAPIVEAASINVAGLPVADRPYVESLFEAVVANTVHSVNGRKGDVWLQTSDILQAGAAPIWDAHFGGHITAPTSWNVYANDDTVATIAWVQKWACDSGLVVSSLNGRGGAVTLNADDISIALISTPGTYALANTPPLGDASKRIANTLFVDSAIEDVRDWTTAQFETHNQVMLHNFAQLDSPNFVGIPTAPTANAGTNTGQIATTAFVQQAVVASTTGVSTWNGRTGAVVLTSADLVTAGAATLNSPAFTGNPSAPTAAPGDNSTRLATTAFVEAAVAAVNAGVTTFNGRTGVVNLLLADITGVGGAPIASPNFSGTPTAPTPGPTNNSTQLATTAFVQNLLAALPAPVSSFNGRTGAVTLIGADVSAAGGALTASPTFTGTPQAPTAVAGTSTQQLATTAFVQNALSASVAGVSTWNGRSGAVTMSSTDISNAGGALIASPTFTGIPSAPTATAGTNSTQLATTAFVQAALSAAPGGVSSFNTRTGAITLNSGDVSAAGGALINSPSFTGTPSAPTAGPGTATTQLATTAFVMTAIAAGGGVSSFNGRAGAITLTIADITGAGGAPLTSPSFNGNPTAPTAAPGDADTSIATTAFVAAALAALPPPFTQSDTAPNVTGNQLWFDSVGGQLYVQYVDPGTQAKSWVIANSPQSVPATSGSLVSLAKTVIGAAVASVSFQGVFTSAYNRYKVRITGLTVASTAALFAQFMNGASVIGGTGYSTAMFFALNGNTGNYNGNTSQASAALTVASDATAGYCQQAEFDICNVRSTVLFKYLYGDGASLASSGVSRYITSAVLQQAAAVDGINFLLTSSINFTGGTIEIFGVQP